MEVDIMKIYVFFLGLFLILPLLAQVDTVIVEDEPLIIHEEVYFAPPKIPMSYSVLVGTGMVRSKQFFPTKINSNFSVTSVFCTTVGLRAEKKGIVVSLNLQTDRLTYHKIEDRIDPIFTFKSERFIDTNITYREDSVYVEGGYYPYFFEPYYIANNRYDTTYVIRDSSYYERTDSVYKERFTARMRVVSIPIYIGFEKRFNKMSVVVNGVVTPSFIYSPQNDNQSTSFKNTISISYGMRLELFRDFNYGKFALGLGGEYRYFSNLKLDDNMSRPSSDFLIQALWRYNF